jgi:glycosyltransferase involved in cell wall biosynthesis
MVILVTTTENSGIDRYSQELAKRLLVPTIGTRRHRSVKDTLHLAGKLSQYRYPLHLPSQHFGRYGLFLLTPFIVTVHDLARVCFPFAAEGIEERVVLKLDAPGLKRAAHIIAISTTTKTDLVRYLHIHEVKVSVAYNGVDRTVFKPTAGKRFDFPYLLYVGSEPL